MPASCLQTDKSSYALRVVYSLKSHRQVREVIPHFIFNIQMGIQRITQQIIYSDFLKLTDE